MAASGAVSEAGASWLCLPTPPSKSSPGPRQALALSPGPQFPASQSGLESVPSLAPAVGPWTSHL